MSLQQDFKEWFILFFPLLESGVFLAFLFYLGIYHIQILFDIFNLCMFNAFFGLNVILIFKFFILFFLFDIFMLINFLVCFQMNRFIRVNFLCFDVMHLVMLIAYFCFPVALLNLHPIFLFPFFFYSSLEESFTKTMVRLLNWPIIQEF